MWGCASELVVSVCVDAGELCKVYTNLLALVYVRVGLQVSSLLCNISVLHTFWLM